VRSFFGSLREAEDTAQLPIGAAGFCWGGKHAVLLAADETLSNGKPALDAAFVGHPSMLAVPGDVEKMRQPVSFAIGDKDSQVTMDAVASIKEIVEVKLVGEARGEVVVYEGCGHGFCVRADTSTASSVAKQAALAEDQCIRWFDRVFGFKS
jgi:dienelactone hydrolase